MITTRSPSRRSRTERRHDVVDGRDVARRLARRGEIRHELLGRQPLVLRQVRPVHGRDDHVVGGAERARERLLEDPAARRGRPRLEDGPDAARRGAPPAAPASVSAMAVGWWAKSSYTVTPPTVPTASSRRFTPLKRSQARRRASSASRPTAWPTASAASALRTLCAPSSGTSNVPSAAPRCRTLKRVPAGGTREVVARASRPRRSRPNVSTGERATPSIAARLRAVGAEQQQAAAGHEVHEAAERQADRVEVRVDVGVVELDVADDRDVRQVLQELRRLVEEGAVVLVALDDELAAAARADSSSPSSPKFAAMPPTSRLGSRPAGRQQPRRPAPSSSSCRACRRSTIDRAPQRKCSRTASGSEQ